MSILAHLSRLKLTETTLSDTLRQNGHRRARSLFPVTAIEYPLLQHSISPAHEVTHASGRACGMTRSTAMWTALRCAREAFGADRLVLGTDFPHLAGDRFNQCVSYIQESDLPPEDKRAILERNAQALLGLEDR